MNAATIRNGPRWWREAPPYLRRTVGAVLVIAALIAFPFAIRAAEAQNPTVALLSSLNVALLYVVLALGLNIVVGFAGLLDLGYAAFFALGAYGYGIMTWPQHDLQWTFWIAILFVPLVAAAFGLLIGAPTLRLRGDYLAIVTLAFGEIVPNALRNLDDINIPWLGLNDFNLTNGTQGMNPVATPVIDLRGIFPAMQPLSFGTNAVYWYFLIVLIGAVVLFGSRRLEESRLGRAWKAIREDETAADCMGVNPISTKLLAFALGAAFSGIAGGVFAAMTQAVFPELFRFQVSIFILIIVIISGMGNVWGVLVGGIILVLFDRILLAQMATPILKSVGTQLQWPWLAALDVQLYRWVLFGGGLLIIMLIRPEGLFPSRARRAELHEGDYDHHTVVETGKRIDSEDAPPDAENIAEGGG